MGAWSHRAAERDLDAEFQSHLEHAVDDLVRQGMAREDAVRIASARFGSRLSAREYVQDQRWWRRLDQQMVDLRLAWRGLRASPLFTLGVVAILGLGVGINTAVFTAVNAALFKGFAGVPDQDRLVYLTTGRDCCISYQDLLDWRGSSTTLSDLGAVADLRVAVETASGPFTATATEITANTLRVIGVQPRIGRDFTAEDEKPGAAAVALVSGLFWHSHLGGTDDAVGKTIRVNGAPTTVIGVMPDGFSFPQNQQLWLPLRSGLTGQSRSDRRLWFGVGRLTDGSTATEARAEMAAIGQRLAVAHPDTNRSITPRLQRFEAIFVGPDAALTYGALWAGVGVLLAIAVANLSTLLLARGAARSRQAAIQLALGAGRARILGQQLCESLLLSIGGGLVGWVVATAMLRAYGAIAVPPTQAWAAGVLDYRVDGRVVAYLVMVSAVAGMAAGWFPGLRSLALDPLTAIRDGARGTAGGHRARSLDRVAIVAQVALAVILIAAAGVLVRSVIAVHTRSLGYDPAASLVTLTMPPAARYPSVESQLAFYDRAMAQLRTLPGVETVGYSDAGVGGTRVAVEVEGRLVIDPDERPEVRSLAIGGDYFQSLGTSLVSGRDLTGEDGTGTRPVLIVNRAFEARHFGTDSALGQRVRLAAGSSGPWLTIVGIAPDLAHGDRVRAAVEPTVYLPLRMRPGRGAWLVLRTTGTPSALVNAVRRELQAVDRDVPVWLGPFTLQEWLASSYWRRGINSGLFSVFGFLALVLAASGLFAVTAGSVARRTREFGVRIAMGATARDIRWLVVRDSAMPAALGLAIGLLGSMATNQWLRAELTGVAPVDPVTLGAAAVLMVASGAVGCLLPASRAARADPLAAIRLD